MYCTLSNLSTPSLPKWMLHLLSHQQTAESWDLVRSSCAVTSLVDHDLTEYGAEQSAVSVGDASCFDVQVAGASRSSACHVQAASEQGVVEARHRTAQVLVEVVLTASGLVVGVQYQLIHVVHVVTVRRRCRRRRRRVLCGKTSTAAFAK